MTREEVLRRWPRLVRCSQWVAILSEGEATQALLAYADPDSLWAIPEAVDHFTAGRGPLYLIRAAIRCRAAVRRLHGGRYIERVGDRVGQPVAAVTRAAGESPG